MKQTRRRQPLVSSNIIECHLDSVMPHDQIFQLLLVYLDDIIIFSSSFGKDLVRLDKVLARLEQHGLKFNPAKCQFLRWQVAYLGYRISAEGVYRSGQDYSSDELESSWQFVKDLMLSKIAGPLHDLDNWCLHELKTRKHLTVPFAEQ